MGSVVVRDGSKCRQMRNDGKRYLSKVVKYCAFRAYLSNFRLTFSHVSSNTQKGTKWRTEPEQKRTETRLRRQTAKSKRMRSNSKW